MCSVLSLLLFLGWQTGEVWGQGEGALYGVPAPSACLRLPGSPLPTAHGAKRRFAEGTEAQMQLEALGQGGLNQRAGALKGQDVVFLKLSPFSPLHGICAPQVAR